MIIPRSVALPEAIKTAAKSRGRARVRVLIEVYDHETQRYRYVKGASWATDIAGDQGGALEAGISAVMQKVEKRL
jgi:hypothetical protein